MHKIGLFAGTFDPVHIGHLEFAKLAQEVCGLEKVLFMPEDRPRGKVKVTPLKKRIDMLRVALKGINDFEVHETGEEHFTLSATMPKIRADYPGSEYIVLLGSDTAVNLPKWEGVEDTEIGLQYLIAFRGKQDNEALINMFASSPLAQRIKFIDSPMQSASASTIRAGKVSSGIKAVDKYITEQRLY